MHSAWARMGIGPDATPHGMGWGYWPGSSVLRLHRGGGRRATISTARASMAPGPAPGSDAPVGTSSHCRRLGSEGRRCAERRACGRVSGYVRTGVERLAARSMVAAQLALLAGLVWSPGKRQAGVMGARLVGDRRRGGRGRGGICCWPQRYASARADRFTAAVGRRPAAHDRCTRVCASPDLHLAAARRPVDAGLGVVGVAGCAEADRWQVEPAQCFEVGRQAGGSIVDVIGVVADHLCGVA